MESNTKEILNRPFERALIKERVGPGGRMLSYVSITDYIARLIEAFDGDWSYEITDARILDEEVVVQIRLTAAGMVKMGMGGAAITKRRDNGKPVSIAHDLMAAEASGLKRACRLLGIGAALYADDDDDAPTPVDNNNRRDLLPQAGAASAQQADGGGSARITNAQLGKLRGLVAETGTDWGTYRDSVRDQHRVNVEYADKKLASRLIDELIGRSQPRSNGNGRGHGNGNGNGNGSSNGDSWRRP